MSKQGRANPRKILYTVALSAIEHNPTIKSLYQFQLQQGKHKMDAIGVCMHKILRIIYGMLKNNTPFDPEIDRKNREKSVQKRKSTKENKIRRYQDYDPNAPISRRQKIKRMEPEQSQSDNGAMSGILDPVPFPT